MEKVCPTRWNLMISTLTVISTQEHEKGTWNKGKPKIRSELALLKKSYYTVRPSSLPVLILSSISFCLSCINVVFGFLSDLRIGKNFVIWPLRRAGLTSPLVTVTELTLEAFSAFPWVAAPPLLPLWEGNLKNQWQKSQLPLKKGISASN